jgi:hypothetical protein
MMVLILAAAVAAPAPAPAPFVLDLDPAAQPSEQAFHNRSLSSWGGNAVLAGDGEYHLFAAAMTMGCNLGAWSSNSEVIHATAASPADPFLLRNVALPPWHHNPQALLHPDGTWLLFTIGTVGVPAPHRCKKTKPLGGPQLGGAARGPKTGEFVQLHHSTSPDGPWTFLNLTGDPANPGIFGGGTTDNRDHGTNPTPVVLPNGTVVVGSHDSEGFYVQVAPSWRGPYTRIPGHLFTFESDDRSAGYVFEDPFLFFDKAARRWRCLMHEYTLAGGGHHLGGAAVSLTPDLLGPWQLQNHSTPAYTLQANDTAGNTETFSRRERPKLLLDAQGQPEVLFTAVCPKQPKGDGLCYTHAQRIKSQPAPAKISLKTEDAPMSAVDPVSGKLLFVDRAVLRSASSDIELEVHPPTKMGAVIIATEPWEAEAVYAYNTMLKVNDTTFFMYYDVIAQNLPTVLRFTALAISHDGITFTKPSLGAVWYNGSRANNLVWPPSDGRAGHASYAYHEPGSVFLDTKPGVPAAERFKMVASWQGGVWVMSSPDGIQFQAMYGKPVVAHSDTQNVAFYDQYKQRYAGYIRIDNAHPPEHPSNETCAIQSPIRRIGRCDLGTKLDPPWPCTYKDAHDVFTFDEKDPACLDIYTNSVTQYYGIYLFFPSVFMHMQFAESEDKGNDGIVEGRLAVSRDGINASYVDAPNGRTAFLPLGVNRCSPMMPSVYPRGVEWCPGNDPASDGASDFDAAEIYTAAGFAISKNQEEIYVYYGGMAYTHGTAGQATAGQHNSGVGAARLRIDGFVSINAPQIFNTLKQGVARAASVAALPGFTTIELTVPSAADCPKPTNRSTPGSPAKNLTTCNYELPGKSCHANGYHAVTCQVAQDCATNTGEPLEQLTCAGLVVGCVTGFCKTTTPAGTHNELCLKYAPASPPMSIIDGGLVLELNVHTGVAGLVFVELQDHVGGTPIPGYTLEESRPVRGNYVRAMFNWVGGSSLTQLAGQKVLMRVRMTDAKLYSASFTCASTK